MPRIKFIAPMLMMALGLNACGKPANWLTYRHDAERDGNQFFESVLSDPDKVLAGLHVGWQAPGPGWTASSPGPFRASPIVFNETVFIGDINGVFWAINAADGTFRWRYPATETGLNGSCALAGNGSWGQYGIQSSASFARISGHDAVIFGAPDPDPATDGGNGSGRLWALDAATGTLIWKSDVIAHVNGCPGSLHERITYSSPLVLSGRVFVGVHDAADNPVQKGKIVASELDTGSLASGFPFTAVGAPGDPTCGGGVRRGHLELARHRRTQRHLHDWQCLRLEPLEHAELPTGTFSRLFAQHGQHKPDDGRL
jgi:PQQ enzyme repeat